MPTEDMDRNDLEKMASSNPDLRALFKETQQKDPGAERVRGLVEGLARHEAEIKEEKEKGAAV